MKNNITSWPAWLSACIVNWMKGVTPHTLAKLKHRSKICHCGAFIWAIISAMHRHWMIFLERAKCQELTVRCFQGSFQWNVPAVDRNSKWIAQFIDWRHKQFDLKAEVPGQVPGWNLDIAAGWIVRMTRYWTKKEKLPAFLTSSV